MKFRFEPDLDFQLEAVKAVCDLFRGQERSRFEFTVLRERPTLGLDQSDLGVGNRLALSDKSILENLQAVQTRNNLPESPSLRDSWNFTVEMETGTGKTYVYLRTIFELNKRFGFTKFVIVVPSIAIKEGVHKSLQMTRDHFRSLYSGVPFESFLYDSSKLGQVRNFAASPHIQIMVATVGAINKRDINNLYRDSEKTGGEKPIDLIRATNPILIVDEPQSVDGGLAGRGREALKEMNPLCQLRYSATHVDPHHQIYRLDAVAAWERKLVKQIEVASATVEDAHNQPFVRLISTRNQRGVVSAQVELDVATASGKTRRAKKMVLDGDDLEGTTKRAVYRDCHIGEILVGGEDALLELKTPGGERFLAKDEAWGDVDSASVHRQMIRRTIREHLDKEQRLHPRGIKALSLFFIDEVKRYRSYDAAGGAVKGAYARMFEEEYRQLAGHRDYRKLFEETGFPKDAGSVHDGYFSIDKKRRWTDTAETNKTGRECAERAYNLIMRDKEKLLDPDEPLRFIFSHSALREGWDNPNVFQICALRDIHAERERRQTIGRGLRLCVDRNGERLRGFDPNTLTVIARESYEEFAENLQREMTDAGIHFDVRSHIRDADKRHTVRPRQTVLDSTEFKELWDRIKHKTRYRVQFDSETLIGDAIAKLQAASPIPRARMQWRTASMALSREGVQATETGTTAPVGLDENDIDLPDLLTELQNRTQLTRRSIHRIVVASRRLEDFQRNPQRFLETAAQVINTCKREALVDGIKYRKIGNDSYFAQELFQQKELSGYLEKMLKAKKSVHEQVVWESEIERQFADDMEKNEAFKVYAKLPSWFRVPTPLGDYNPDWAILADTEEGERLYFVVETKGSTLPEDLRLGERSRIQCGKAYVDALRVGETDVHYESVSSANELLSRYPATRARAVPSQATPRER